MGVQARMWNLTLLDIGAALTFILFAVTLLDAVAGASSRKPWAASAIACAVCLALFALFYGASLRFPG